MGDQDRRMMLAIVLSMGVYLIWLGSFGPQPTVEEPASEILEEDASTASTDNPSESSTNGEGEESAESQSDESAEVETAPVENSNAGYAVSRHADSTIEMKNPDGMDTLIEGTAKDYGNWTAELSSDNGSVRNIVLKDYTTAPMYHSLWGYGIDKVLGAETATDGWTPFSGDSEQHELLGPDSGLLLAGGGNDGHFTDDGAGDLDSEGPWNYALSEGEDGTLQAVATTDEGLRITKTYQSSAEPYQIDVSVRFENLNSDKSISNLWVGVAERMSGDAGRFMSAIRPNAYVDESIENIYDIEDLSGDGVESFDGRIDWFGVGDRYFMAVLIRHPDESYSSQLIVDELPGGRVGSFVVYDEPLPPSGDRTYNYTAYVGPKSLDILEPMGEEIGGPLGESLGQAVEFGWFGLFSKPLLWLLKSLHDFVGNWGVAIILLTLLIKLAFFRLTQKTYESSHRMQALQPQLKEIREKYSDNRELQTQETMKLFREHKVNPAGSCLPMLLQLPVWFALYNTMLYSVELYHTQFLIFEDLTAPDPYGILPTLYILLMVGQQRMMPMASMDPTQRKVMKSMPFIFGFFMYTFPSGLVLYFCVNMLLTMLQQWIIKRNLGEVPTLQTAS